jgi:hypothetical protein
MLVQKLRTHCAAANPIAFEADPSIDIAEDLPQALFSPLCLPIVVGAVKTKESTARRIDPDYRKAYGKAWDVVLGPLWDANGAARGSVQTGAVVPQWKQDLLARKKARTDEADANPDEEMAAPAEPQAQPDDVSAVEAVADPSRTRSGSLDGVIPVSIEPGTIPWKSAVAVKLLAGGLGSSGVIVVVMEPEKGGARVAAVVKPGHPANLVAEAFGTKILRAFGLEAPRARPVPYDEAPLVGKALSKESLYDRAEDRSVPWAHFKKGGQMWLLTEYVPGLKLYAFGGRLPDPPRVLRQVSIAI